mmetsp:Transcript_8475/g.29692  ORF Transcript_8475/g.29692 Transcript_8475/m.29692 type:complete len:234 (+) Transcript_8475:276-977(+)
MSRRSAAASSDPSAPGAHSTADRRRLSGKGGRRSSAPNTLQKSQTMTRSPCATSSSSAATGVPGGAGALGGRMTSGAAGTAGAVEGAELLGSRAGAASTGAGGALAGSDAAQLSRAPASCLVSLSPAGEAPTSARARSCLATKGTASHTSPVASRGGGLSSSSSGSLKPAASASNAGTGSLGGAGALSAWWARRHSSRRSLKGLKCSTYGLNGGPRRRYHPSSVTTHSAGSSP